MKSTILLICLIAVVFFADVPQYLKVLEYIFYFLSVPTLVGFVVKL
jgi:hypothetical protein